ncbi:ATP-binding protein [Aquiflexum sp.]|uniref:ATP-binding protein n=1 Tax=Aquiflexum sp. TaxID=1872584 RepID=UPI0035935306
MNKEKRQLLDKTYQTFMDVGLGQNNLDLLVDIVAKDIFGFGSAIDEKISGLNELQELLKRQKEQSAGMDLRWNINTLDIHISSDENTAIFTNEVTFYITIETEKIEMLGRFSVVLEYVLNKWIIVHWHGSKPEQVESEKDTWGLEIWKEKAEALEKEVAERTADLIEKNRELQVEAALERVRATAMAMQKSGDLRTVVEILYEQLRNLGFQWGVASIVIMDPDTGDLDWWMEGFGDGYVLPERYHVPYFEHSGHLRQLEHWKSGIPYAEIEISGEEKKTYDAYYFYQTDFSKAPEPSKQLMMQHESVRFSMAFMKYGALSWSPTPLIKEQATILERFAKVFEQCYTRFLDLQKAEEQAREAQIEAALEKIRSKSLAMHQSDDLKGVVAILFEKLKELGLVFDGGAGVKTFKENSNDAVLWIAAPDYLSSPSIVNIPFEEKDILKNPMLNDVGKARAAGTDIFNKSYSFKEKNDYFNFVYSNNDYNQIPQAVRDWVLQTPNYTGSEVFNHHTSVIMNSYSGELITEKQFEILKRIGKVFEQAYIRFLDLQKAEEQAREAKIEAALERVRSRTMAMHKSEDILEVIRVMTEQFIDLGFDLHSVNISTTENRRDYYMWLHGVNAPAYPHQVFIPWIDHPIINQLQEAFEANSDFVVMALTKEEKDRFYYHLFSNTILKHAPEKRKSFLLATPGYAGSFSLNEKTIVTIVNFQGNAFTADQNLVLKRFATVFEQSYTRFLDLQKAEAQAREAQIEAALERVRARAMAMHASEELKEVARELRMQLGKLGQKDLETCAIHLYEESPDFFHSWAAVRPPKSDGEIIECEVTLPKKGTQLVAEMLEEYFSKKQEYVLRSEGEKAIEWFTLLKTHYPEVVDLIVDSRDSEDKNREQGNGFYFSFADFSGGSLVMVTYDTPDEDSRSLLRRFANVFGIAYRRFADLKKAEAQAREAQIEAALERVRSRSMAMHSSSEILEVAHAMYEQLKQLGFDYGGNTIMIMDKETGDMEWWMAGLGEGKFPEVYKISYFDHPIQNQILEDWRSGKDFAVISVEGDLKQSYDEELFTKNGYRDLPEQVKNWMRQLKSAVFSLAYMKHGALHWGPAPLSEEQALVLQRFARVFDQVYTRFLDLQKAEAQTREAQIEAALERVRSTSLAMHHSEELEKVVLVVYEQLVELRLVFDGTLIFIFDSDKRHITLWIATNRQPAPLKINLPYEADMNDNPIFRDLWHAIDHKESNLNRTYTGKVKDDYFRYVGKHNSETIPQDERQSLIDLPTWMMSYVTEKNSILAIDSWSGKIIRNDDFSILKRFAVAFEQAYTRFLDLQNAEAQAREAQIEAALERVRSSAMAMQSSNDLNTLIGKVFTECTKLDIQLDRGIIMIYDPESLDSTWWMANPEAPDLPMCYHLKYHEHPPYLAILQAWKERHKKWTYTLEGKLKKNWDDFIFQKTELALLPTEVKKTMTGFQKVFLNCSFNNFGCLLLAIIDPMTDSNFQILLRFAKVFDLTYTRFNDLKLAEAQTREAQIETALERIRAKALAMHQSDEFMEVALTLREQMGLLGQKELEASVIHFYNLRRETIQSWHVLNTHRSGNSELSAGSFEIRKNTCRLTHQFFTAFQSENTEYSIVVEGEVLREWLQFLRSMSPEINETIQGLEVKPERAYYYFSKFLEGALLMVSSVPATEESKYLQRRAAQVFELAYKRYKDLKHAEKLARKAEHDFIRLKEEKKKTDEALRELTATQAQLIQSEKMASLGELTAGIAHEIQNPLNFVNNFSEVSAELVDEIKESRAKNQESRPKTEEDEKEDEILEDIKQNLEKINHHGKRADAIVKGMLEHSRASTGEKVPTDINALADEYLRLSYHGMRAKDKSFNADFKTNFDPSLPKVYVVPQDIGRVLLNIINNAFQAVGTGHVGTRHALSLQHMVTVSTKSLDDKIQISISDNGPGIPDPIKDKIFQPFFTTKPTGQGTGLGLSLSYDIVKAHGGELEVNSKEGEGSEFTITLPLGLIPETLSNSR